MCYFCVCVCVYISCKGIWTSMFSNYPLNETLHLETAIYKWIATMHFLH